MSKKNWIFIKRGLSEDPKHREAMGMAVWLFMHICDAADWEKGIVYDWRDKEIGIDMSLSTATVRGWRDRLSDLGYITCRQKQHCLEIIIHNWNNPRVYSGEKMNVRQGDIDESPSISVVTQGESQGDTQGLDGSIGDADSLIESSSLSSSKKERALVFSKLDQEQCNAKVNAILENSAKSNGKGWPGREQIPEPIRPLLDVYAQVTGQHPTKGQLIDWLQSGNEWLEQGATVNDIREAYKKAKPEKGDGFMVTRPGSLTRTIGMIVGERRADGKSNMNRLDRMMAELQESAERNQR